MRFVQFQSPSCATPVAGLELDNDFVNLTAALGMPNVLSIVQEGEAAVQAARKVAESGRFRVSKSEAKLLAPIDGVDKLLCVGMNYVDHCTEQNYPIPEEPIIFNKCPQTIVASGVDIEQPPLVTGLDFEVELAVIIGKGGRNIPKSKAAEHIFGYTVAHDVSARHWQMKRNGGQWFIGKTFDTFTPLGPAIVTHDSIDVNNLPIKCFLNGETVQNSTTQQLIFKCTDVVAWCSQFMTLRPGDIILTGTPPGVGCFRNPPLWLKPGDTVRCEIGNIGSIENTVIASPPVYQVLTPRPTSTMAQMERRVLSLELRMEALAAGNDVAEGLPDALNEMKGAELRTEVRKLQHRLRVLLKLLDDKAAKM
eukprot:g4194.t1